MNYKSRHKQNRIGEMTLFIPCLLEYICPGGKDMNLSQSSIRAFILDANHIDPVNKSTHPWIIYLIRFCD